MDYLRPWARGRAQQFWIFGRDWPTGGFAGSSICLSGIENRGRVISTLDGIQNFKACQTANGYTKCRSL